MTSRLDIEDLISRGNFELADVMCDVEIDRLLSIKREILRGVERPSLVGDMCVGLHNGRGPGIVGDERVNNSLILGSIPAGQSRIGGMMQHESSVLADMAMRNSEPRDCGNGLHRSGVVEVKLERVGAKVVVQGDSVVDGPAGGLE